MAPVLIQARFTFMKNKYRSQNNMGFFCIYLIVISDMGFHKWFANAHAQCDNVLRTDIVLTYSLYTLFDITFCLWLYMSCRSVCCNVFNDTE